MTGAYGSSTIQPGAEGRWLLLTLYTWVIPPAGTGLLNSQFRPQPFDGVIELLFRGTDIMAGGYA